MLPFVGLLLAIALIIPHESLSAQTSGSLPDLVVQSLTLSPETPHVGDTVHLTATIANTGRGNVSNSFAVVFRVDQMPIDQRTISGLLAHQTTTVETTWKAITGTHTIQVEADPFDEVVESDKTNNALQRTITVLPPEGIQSLTGELLAVVAQGLQGAGQSLQVAPDPDLFKLLTNLTNAFGRAGESFAMAALDLAGAPQGLPDALAHDPQLLTSAKVAELYQGLAKAMQSTQDALTRANLQAGETAMKQAADQLAQLSQISVAGIGLSSVQSASTAILRAIGQAQQLQTALSGNQNTSLTAVVSQLLDDLNATGQQLVAVGASTTQSASQRAVRFLNLKGEPFQHYQSGEAIQITVSGAQPLRWELFDASGVAVVQTDSQKAGQLIWDGRPGGKSLVAGQYFYRVTVEDGSGARIELGRVLVEPLAATSPNIFIIRKGLRWG